MDIRLFLTKSRVSPPGVSIYPGPLEVGPIRQAQDLTAFLIRSRKGWPSHWGWLTPRGQPC